MSWNEEQFTPPKSDAHVDTLIGKRWYKKERYFFLQNTHLN